MSQSGSRRSLSTFSLAPSTLDKLLRAGFRTVADLGGLTAVQLAAELGCQETEAAGIRGAILGPHEAMASNGNGNAHRADSAGASSASSASATKPGPGAAPRSALDMLVGASGASSRPIVTFCRAIDEMLGNGVQMGELTEVCGAPGVGKTQLCMQLALNAQIPPAFGGAGGQAAYIDTEGSLTAERLAQIADALAEHILKVARGRDRAASLESYAGGAWSRDFLLSNVFVFRAHDHVQQLATLRALPRFLDHHPDVKLIVVDSVAFHMRHAFQDLSTRARILSQMAQQLHALARSRSLAVVLVNQMTTRLGSASNSGGGSSAYGSSNSNGGGGGFGARLVPALGESWAHAATSRLLLVWQGQQRLAQLVKSPRHKCGTVPFAVTAAGVRDDKGSHGASGGSDRTRDAAAAEQGDAHKRQRTESDGGSVAAAAAAANF